MEYRASNLFNFHTFFMRKMSDVILIITDVYTRSMHVIYCHRRIAIERIIA